MSRIIGKDCENFVSYCYYPPIGQRSFGPMRAQLIHGSDYFSNANNNILSFAMIRCNIWKGIGISQKGKHKSRFIHLDTIDSDNRPWVWSY